MSSPYRIGIIQRFVLSVAVLALILAIGVTISGYRATSAQMKTQLELQMQTVSEDLSFYIKNHIDELLDNLQLMADNPLVANALADNVGRDLYLGRFFSGISRVGGMELSYNLTDFSGKPIAGAVDNPALLEQLREPISQAIEANESHMWVGKGGEGEAILLLMSPVIYANTGQPEGALLYKVPLYGLFQALNERNVTPTSGSLVSNIHFTYHDRRLDTRGVMTMGVAVENHLKRELKVALPMDHEQLSFKVTVEGNQQVFARHYQALLKYHLGIGVVTFLIAVGLAYPIGYLLLKRLTRLQRSATHMIEGGSLSQRLPEAGDDEVAHLAKAFNAVLGRLEHAYTDLEDSSKETIAGQAAKYQAVVDQASEALLLWDDEGRLTEANHAAVQLIGIGFDQLQQCRREEILTVRARDREWAPSEGVWESDIKVPGREAIAVEVSASNVTIGPQIYNLWMIRDIRERLAAQQLREERQQYLEGLAFYDPLTHLPNRRMLSDRLQHAIAMCNRARDKLAVCYLDLDGFKPVNDTLGHDAGDEVLIAVAERLSRVTRAEDTVARLGGDEFVVLLGGLKGYEECVDTLTRILDALAVPHYLQEQSFNVSASIGVTLYPDDHDDADTLIRHADQAMYLAKQRGRSQFHFFDREKDSQAQDRQVLLQEIATAIELEQLQLVYQPKVDMGTGQVVGAEVLVRWLHPDRGLLAPGTFLPYLVGHPLSLQLDHYVLQRSLAQLSVWHNQGLKLEMSINISASTLQEPEFLPKLEEELKRQPDLPRDAIQLEILESEIIDDLDLAVDVINGCAGMGLKVSLDDFGTGYSSLLYFRRLPVNELKIDQTFVRNILKDTDDLSIVQGVIKLAEAFDRRVVAEGVETLAHGTLLLLLGCHVAQGYGIARPMAAEELPNWIAGYHAPELWSQDFASEAWSPQDLPLLTLEADHWNWVEMLAARISGLGGNLELPMGATSCAFGQWYYGEGRKHYQHIPAFTILEPTHTAIHTLGNELLELAQTDPRAARERLEEVYELRDTLLSQLHELQMNVLLHRSPQVRTGSKLASENSLKNKLLGS